MKRRSLLILIAGLIVVVSTVIVILFMKSRPKEETKQVQVVELESIKDYGYVLEDRDSKLYREVFKDLREVLNQETIDFKKYSEDVSKLFIIDLYTINNKINKYDIGGLEFIWPSSKETFERKVQDTIYKYVEDNTYGKRNQELPTVTEINIDSIKENNTKIGESNRTGFELEVSWKYEKEDGYDTKGIIEVAKEDNKIFVVKLDTKKE